MTLLEVWWMISLAAEGSVIAVAVKRMWHKVYPSFFLYLLFDLTASIGLFFIARLFPAPRWPGLYDYAWRATNLVLVVGRIFLVFESYWRLANVKIRWRFSDGMVYPIAALAAITLHLELVRPFLWPDSRLETVFGLIGAAHALLGFTLIGILVASHRRSMRGTVPYRHAQILCAYLLATCGCYYTASQQPASAGLPLMIVATVCYVSWFVCLSRGRDRARTYLEEEGHAAKA